MSAKKYLCVFGLTLILLVTLVGQGRAQGQQPPPQSALTPGVSNWQQMNTSGFGNPMDENVKALEVFNGDLYAGTINHSDGGQVWRTSNGSDWTAVSERGFGSTYTNKNTVVFDMIEFKGQLYAGTGEWVNVGAGGQIWRCTTCDGSDWELVEGGGFGSADNSGVSLFGVFGDTLYAGTINYNSGTEIWRSTTGNSGDWTSVVTGGNGDFGNYTCTSLTEFKGYLYATAENTFNGMEIWRTTDGRAWSRIATGGFGDWMNNQWTGGLAVLGSYLYVGTGSDSGIARVYRSSNGTKWSHVGIDGFGDSNNYQIDPLIAFAGALFASTENSTSGTEVWRSTNGTTWSQINADGFGNSNNVATYWNSATAIFQNSLYFGTQNSASGGEVWRDNDDHSAPTPPSVPKLVAPAKNALVTDLTPLLDWKDSTLKKGVNFDYYQVQVATDAAFNATILDKNIPGITNSNDTLTSDLAMNTIYYWRVRAFNLYGNASNWSAARSFHTPLLAPTLLAPPDHATTYYLADDPRPVFDWEDVQNATSYSIQISKNITFSSLVGTYKVTSSTYQPKVSLPSVPIYWRVQAKNKSGSGAWSIPWLLIEESVSDCDSCH